MELKRLYDIVSKENISVFNVKTNNKAIISSIEDKFVIGLNYSIIDNSSEEKTVVAEELGHYYTNSLYNSTTSLETIGRKEFRAKKWAFQTLIPVQKLKTLLDKGCKYSYEFAEELGVTEDLINIAYDYYRKNNMLICKNR